VGSFLPNRFQGKGDVVVALTDKVCVVTGAARGIGEATLERLVRRGATAIGLDVDADLGEKVAASLGKRASFRFADVTDGASVDAAFESILSEHGAVHGLVNNAGVAAYYDAATMTDDEWDGVFAVDLKGVWRCSKAVLPIMRAQGGGSIVNISSIHARMTASGSFPYAAAKSGVCGMTRSLALDEGRHGIRVNAVCPGYVGTRLVDEFFDQQADPAGARAQVAQLNPLRRILEPQEVAGVVEFLLSDASSGMTGSEVIVDAGLSARFA
jgi:NAD(P)-dependent dehydrogenase (short-subunit alcohol dehydrogenase family)